LPYDIEETDLRNIFQQMGAVGLDRIHLPMDHATGRKRGFAFVSFLNEEAAKTGLEAVGDLNIRGRQCTVHIAHPRGERPPPRERPSFGGPPGGAMGGGGMRSSPPPGMGGGGGGGGPSRGGFGPPAPPGGLRPRPRADGEGEARGAKGVTRKNRLEQEKRRGGGNARRYMDDVDDDE
jgi:RNA recognition motif-containing protein